jgi:predicted nucleic acid-binding Zn ribbon protein
MQAMRKSNTQPIENVIREYLKEMSIDQKLKEVGIVSQWEKLMGKTVAVRTSHIYIRNHILYIHVTSSVLKNELLMMRQAIIEKINEEAGERIVEQMVIK